MSEFHCPMGAPYPGDEACIDCGGCLATTKEEMDKALTKVRECLRERAERPVFSKKVAICGKGGTGKSTVAALIATILAEEGNIVLVIDADESNPGLYRMLGFDRQPGPLSEILDRLSSNDTDQAKQWLKQDQIFVPDIPKEFVIERDGLKFMMVGKVEDPFAGCACPMADTARVFIGKLVIGQEFVVVDTEAGVESFGRGVERNTDTVLIIVEPSMESLNLAGKIDYMAQAMGISKVGAILNKVPSKEIEGKMIERLKQKYIRYFGTVYLDPQVSEASFEGKPLGNSKAKEDLSMIVKLFLARE